MKYVWYFIPLLFCQLSSSNALTVPSVKVSVTAESAAAAREKALAEAHTLAFSKLMKEMYSEESPALPPQDTLMNMVITFSIDREKTTPNSYTALMTFQFDEPKVQEWLEQRASSSAQKGPSLNKEESSLKITALYTTQQEWQTIKKALENKANRINVIALSPKKAELDITYGGGVLLLQQYLQQKGLDLTLQGEQWEVSVHTLNNKSRSSNT